MSSMIGTARKASMVEARRAFTSGAGVVVTERPEGPERIIWADTTVNHQGNTTWIELHGQVKMWRNRYPNQTFYVVEGRA